jgi:hypothetical protein
MARVPLTYEQVNEFIAIESALSPENLMRDGERPMAAARRIKASLVRRWKELEAVVGRPVSADEVWNAYLARPRVGLGMTVKFK